MRDTFFLVCDGLKGLPEVVGNVWPLTTAQTRIIHLIRNTFKLASKKDRDALKRHGAIIRLWESARDESDGQGGGSPLSTHSPSP